MVFFEMNRMLKILTNYTEAYFLNESEVTIRCLPLDQDKKPGKRILTGKDTAVEAIFGKAY